MAKAVKWFRDVELDEAAAFGQVKRALKAASTHSPDGFPGWNEWAALTLAAMRGASGDQVATLGDCLRQSHAVSADLESQIPHAVAVLARFYATRLLQGFVSMSFAGATKDARDFCRWKFTREVRALETLLEPTDPPAHELAKPGWRRLVLERHDDADEGR